MGDKNVVVYLDDNQLMATTIVDSFVMPKMTSSVKFVKKTSLKELTDAVEKNAVSISDIAAVCTTEKLGDGKDCYAVCRFLIDQEYKGPLIYTGAVEPKKEYECLFSDIWIRTSGEEFTLPEILKKYL